MWKEMIGLYNKDYEESIISKMHGLHLLFCCHRKDVDEIENL